MCWNMKLCVGNTGIGDSYIGMIGEIQRNNEELMQKTGILEMHSITTYTYVGFFGTKLYSGIKNEFTRLK